MASRAPAPPLWPLACLFALSGAGALVVETTWMRWLRDLLGATAPAAAATTVAFFAGGALGAGLGGRLAGRLADRGRALRAYAGIELLAVAGALATPALLALGTHLMGALYPFLQDAPATLLALRFGLALLATLPAGVAYGATFPVIGAAALPDPGSLGSRGSGLYATNTAGAALGAGAAAWWLPPHLGVVGTYGVGVALALAAAAGAAGLAFRTATPAARPSAAPPAAEDAAMAASPLALAALSGFVALAAQVLLVQAFAQVVNQSVVAFGAVLVTLLGGLALGAYGVAALRRRGLAPPRTLLAWALVASALGLAAFPALLFRATGGLGYIGGGGGPYALAVVLTVVGTAGPALLASACVWPATLALAGQAPEPARSDAARRSGGAAAGARIGRLAVANTLGAIAGAIAAPFVLLPVCGLWGAFAGLAAICGAGALVLAFAAGARRLRVAAAVAAGALAVGVVADPLALPLTATASGERVVDQRATAAGVVSVVERDRERLIRIDNHYALGGTSERRHEERQGHLPLVLHGSARRVAFVGTATGITAGAALAHDVERIQLVEIVPEVARMAGLHFERANRGVYDDGRSRVALDDARNYFRQAQDRFDVIVADLFVPWRAGTGALYTREHLEAVRDRLAPGGLFCQWLPLYQLSDDEVSVIVATFGDVFPTAGVFRGDFYGAFPILALVGWGDRPAAARTIETAARGLARAGVEDRWVTDPLAIWSLYVAPAPADPERRVPRNLDAWPRIEFMAARRHAGGRHGKLDPLVGSAWMRRAAAWQRAAPSPDPLFPGLSPEALRARRAGDALQLAGALFAEGRTGESSRALAVGAELLPRRLLLDAPADPSALEVWFEPER
ncbi:MAG: spermidine synthase [Myxococcota bacterium]